jgi:hypothetical protein
MLKRISTLSYLAAGMATFMLTASEALSQPGRGKGGGGRSAGHAAPSAPKSANAGPAMTRPGGASKAPAKPAGISNVGKPGGATSRPSVGAAAEAKPNGGFQRPTSGNQVAAKRGGEGPQAPGKASQPKIVGERPGSPGKIDRPNATTRPGSGPSSSQLNDFLGGGGRPSEGLGRPDLGKGGLPNVGKDNSKFGKENLPKIGKDDPKFSKDNLPKIGQDDSKFGKGELPKVGDRGQDSPNINVGNVNIGNSVDYSKDQKAWVANQHANGNQVRVNAGNRYTGACSNGVYRQGAVGGYPYYNGWNNQGPYYGWRPVTYAAFGTFLGATWATASPRYYAYGNGGNVYYENNVVYVDGQAAGTPEQYAQQSTALVAAAPAQVTDTEWLPLGAFALTREGVDDSQAMLELAVNKQGVLAGTYYNEATAVSRSLKGKLDQTSQRAALGFADGKNAEVVLETGIYNLTQDEAPALLHQGPERSTPVLLVRLQAPADNVGK